MPSMPEARTSHLGRGQLRFGGGGLSRTPLQYISYLPAASETQMHFGMLIFEYVTNINPILTTTIMT